MTARIIFTTWGSLGNLHPYMALALELLRRGHDVAVATVPAWQANVEIAGLSACRCGRMCLRRTAPEIVRRVLDPREGPPYLFTQVFAPALRDTCADTVAAVRGARSTCPAASP